MGPWLQLLSIYDSGMFSHLPLSLHSFAISWRYPSLSIRIAPLQVGPHRSLSREAQQWSWWILVNLLEYLSCFYHIGKILVGPLPALHLLIGRIPQTRDRSIASHIRSLVSLVRHQTREQAVPRIIAVKWIVWYLLSGQWIMAHCSLACLYLWSHIYFWMRLNLPCALPYRSPG